MLGKHSTLGQTQASTEMSQSITQDQWHGFWTQTNDEAADEQWPYQPVTGHQAGADRAELVP